MTNPAIVKPLEGEPLDEKKRELIEAYLSAPRIVHKSNSEMCKSDDDQ
jgi:hypothetical protein